MLEWMMKFTAIAMGSIAAAMGGDAGQIAGFASSLVFGFLLVIST